MAVQCDLCGKGPLVGTSVATANNKTKKRIPTSSGVRAVVEGRTSTSASAPLPPRRARSRRRPERPRADDGGHGSAILDVSRRAARAAGGRRQAEADLIFSPRSEQLVGRCRRRSSTSPGRHRPDDAAELVAMSTAEQFRHSWTWRPARAEGRPAHARGDPLACGSRARLRRSGEVPQAALGAGHELLRRFFRATARHDLTEEEPPSPQDPGMAYYTSTAGSCSSSSVRASPECARADRRSYAQDRSGPGG